MQMQSDILNVFNCPDKCCRKSYGGKDKRNRKRASLTTPGQLMRQGLSKFLLCVSTRLPTTWLPVIFRGSSAKKKPYYLSDVLDMLKIILEYKQQERTASGLKSFSVQKQEGWEDLC
jgi:hypothetical protein